MHDIVQLNAYNEKYIACLTMLASPFEGKSFEDKSLFASDHAMTCMDMI